MLNTPLKLLSVSKTSSIIFRIFGAYFLCRLSLLIGVIERGDGECMGWDVIGCKSEKVQSWKWEAAPAGQGLHLPLIWHQKTILTLARWVRRIFNIHQSNCLLDDTDFYTTGGHCCRDPTGKQWWENLWCMEEGIFFFCHFIYGKKFSKILKSYFNIDKDQFFSAFVCDKFWLLSPLCQPILGC